MIGMRLVMDYIVQKIVALGIPGIVLLVAIAASRMGRCRSHYNYASTTW